MATVPDLTSQIEEARKKLQPLGQYTESPSGFEFGEILRERMTATPDIESLIRNIATQRARMLAIPAETRAQAPIGVYSPTQMAGLIEQKQEPVRATQETLMGVKRAREGRIEDIIDRATRGYEATIAKAESKYQKAYQELQDLVAEKRWIEEQKINTRQMELQEKEVGLRYGETGTAWDTLARQYLNGDDATKKKVMEQMNELTPTAQTEFYKAVNSITTKESKTMTDDEIKADIAIAKSKGKSATEIAQEVSGDWTIANKERYLEILQELAQSGEIQSQGGWSASKLLPWRTRTEKAEGTGGWRGLLPW